MYRCTLPLARLRVAPGAVTLLGALVAAALLAPAAGGGAWPLLAALLLLANGLLDGVDGCLALLTGRATRWGYVLDSAADRISDGLLVVALWLAGAPAAVCLAAGGVAALQEYVRARAGNADGVTPTESEVPTGMPAGAFGDNIGGITIAGAVAAALYGRQTTGQTSVIDVSLLAVGAWANQSSVNLAMLYGCPLPKIDQRTQAPGNPLTGAYRINLTFRKAG